MIKWAGSENDLKVLMIYLSVDTTADEGFIKTIWLLRSLWRTRFSD